MYFYILLVSAQFLPSCASGPLSSPPCLWVNNDINRVRFSHNFLVACSDYREAARRAGGGFVNHDLFWNVLSPWGGHPPGPESDTIQERHLASAIDRSFGSFAEMQYAFSNAASAFSGSG